MSSIPSCSVLTRVLPLQDVVPQALLDQYLSMTDPSRAQTVDMEIAKHCAYSLPGVALTLGRQNWHCLRDTYETLASDMQVLVSNYSYNTCTRHLFPHTMCNILLLIYFF